MKNNKESKIKQVHGRSLEQKHLDSIDKVVNIGGLSLIPVLLLLLIVFPMDWIQAIAFEMDSDTVGLLITAIFLIIIFIIIAFFLIIEKNSRNSEKRTNNKLPLSTKYDRKKDKNRKSGEIQSLKKMPFVGRILWITSFLIGFLAIVLYPINSTDVFKFLTLAALLSWVIWNIYSTSYYKPLHTKRIVKWKPAIGYFFITEVPVMMSLGSVIIGTIIRDSSNLLNVVISLSIALAISGLTVVFERGRA